MIWSKMEWGKAIWRIQANLRGLENWIRLLGIVTFRAQRYAAFILLRNWYKTERRRKTAKNFFYINYFCQTFGWKAQEKLKLVELRENSDIKHLS